MLFLLPLFRDVNKTNFFKMCFSQALYLYSLSHKGLYSESHISVLLFYSQKHYHFPNKH